VQDTVQERQRPKSESTAPTRTCVGCGLQDDAGAMVRLVVADDEVAFDLAGSAFGRGAHVHARPGCLAKAPRGLARAFKRAPLEAVELGARLAAACDRRMTGLVLAARRSGGLAIGADAALSAVRRGAPLVIVAVDAASIATSVEVVQAVAEGRAMAWKTKNDLGMLLGEEAVAICAVVHPGIAKELKDVRAAADAAAATTKEGAECSSRRPEAR